MDWIGDMTFQNTDGHPAMHLASSVPDVTSPPQALAYAVMACMAMDVVHVIQKGRCEFSALSVKFEGRRASDHPRRFISMNLHFDIKGDIEDKLIRRAVDLSATTYCSVWNTLNPDVKLTTSHKVHR